MPRDLPRYASLCPVMPRYAPSFPSLPLQRTNMPRIPRHLHRIDSSQFRREEASNSDDESDESLVGTTY
eukprot:scaffold12819_cov104-Skeletonema_dohrnii-CCMP3373.AAC.1